MRFLSLVTATLLLFGCESIDWLGAPEEEALPGKRIPILTSSSSVTADKALKSIPVTLLPPTKNKTWPHSNGGWQPTSGHLRLPANPALKHTIDVGRGGNNENPLTANVVIAEQRLFVQDGQGTITAYDINNPKKQIWKYRRKIKDFIKGGMTYDDGILVITSSTAKVIALNAKNGSLLWERQLNNITRSAPVIDQYRAFISTIDNQLYAIDTSNGKILWQHKGEAETTTILNSPSPAVFDRYVISPYSTGEIYALSSYRGVSLWSDIVSSGKGTSGSFIFSGISTTPLIHKNLIFISSYDGILAALDIHSGRHLWEINTVAVSQPWAAGNFLFTLSQDNKLLSIHIPSGKIKWVTTLPDADANVRWSGPVIGGDRVLVVGSHGKLLSLSPYNGQITNRITVPKHIYASPVIANKKIYLLANNAKLTILE